MPPSLRAPAKPGTPAPHQGESFDGDDEVIALVTAIRAGDPEAETLLIERYRRGIGLLLDRQMGGDPEAEDLLQETFALVIQKLRAGELRQPARLAGFIARIARNLAIEHYRKLRRRRTEADPDAGTRHPSPAPSAYDRLSAADEAQLAQQVLAELPNARDRQILVRFYIADEDRERVASDLGLTNLQFNRCLHRARERYRSLMLEAKAAVEERAARVRHRATAIIAAFTPLLHQMIRLALR